MELKRFGADAANWPMLPADRELQQTNMSRNLAGARGGIGPHPSRESAPLPCPISADAPLSSGGIRRNRICSVTSKIRRFHLMNHVAPEVPSSAASDRYGQSASTPTTYGTCTRFGRLHSGATVATRVGEASFHDGPTSAKVARPTSAGERDMFVSWDTLLSRLDSRPNPRRSGFASTTNLWEVGTRAISVEACPVSGRCPHSSAAELPRHRETPGRRAAHAVSRELPPRPCSPPVD